MNEEVRGIHLVWPENKRNIYFLEMEKVHTLNVFFGTYQRHEGWRELIFDENVQGQFNISWQRIFWLTQQNMHFAFLKMLVLLKPFLHHVHKSLRKLPCSMQVCSISNNLLCRIFFSWYWFPIHLQPLTFAMFWPILKVK